ncbi:Alpha-ketoglutarate-dependent dioxygenase alkB 3 [Mycena sanguinolenta]|uniref:Alpha-ketoglutarate-dependent dioxygenase alkB 3 n=1 Tax=Mycena sanguinolenta TaxID=230812 RepID=A0A8H7D568_9AGAR|nr:Alpha-ketoglutarate-dependent dioxygenase alkB 3 [Mycena sanguinolenta]
MLDLSRQWGRNKWWLVNRLVESPHRTSFFARAETASHGLSAASGDVNTSSWQEAAQFWLVVCHISWRANVAASNCYEGGKESVGFHSDQLTHLGPYPTIGEFYLR